MYLRIGIAAAVLAVAGCGDKKESNGAGSASGSESGESSTDKPSTDKPSGGGKAIDQAMAEEIAKTQIEGFETQAMPPRGSSLSMSFKSEEPAVPDGEKLAITANIGKCMMCQKMDLDHWRANPNLKGLLSKNSQEDPDLVWQIEEIDMGGTKAIYTYALAFTMSEDGKSRSGVNSYNIFYNNGVNQLHLITGCAGGFMPDHVVDEASYKAICPPDKQLEAAKKVFAGLVKHL